jgi:tripartite-type tricarboxylate transporter receptor subunit TctC
MRRRVFAAVLAGCLWSLSCAAAAQGYPHKYVKMLVGWAPGGTVDLIGRVVAQLLSDKLHQQFVVENRPGSSGMLVDLQVMAAAPDGYVLQTAGSTHATNPSLYADAKYDPVKDFTPITLVASTPYVLVADPKLPVKSIAEFREWTKKQPDAITFGSAGNGSRQHLAAVMLMNLIGAKMVHVPYKGSMPAVTDLLGGHIPVLFENVTVVLPYIKSGKMRALGVTAETRSSLLPEVPTMIESGFPGFEISGYFGVYGPPRLPANIVGVISGTINAALKTPELQQSLARIGAEPVGGSPESFATFLQRDVDTWSKVIREAGITVN